MNDESMNSNIIEIKNSVSIDSIPSNANRLPDEDRKEWTCVNCDHTFNDKSNFTRHIKKNNCESQVIYTYERRLQTLHVLALSKAPLAVATKTLRKAYYEKYKPEINVSFASFNSHVMEHRLYRRKQPSKMSFVERILQKDTLYYHSGSQYSSEVKASILKLRKDDGISQATIANRKRKNGERMPSHTTIDRWMNDDNNNNSNINNNSDDDDDHGGDDDDDDDDDEDNHDGDDDDDDDGIIDDVNKFPRKV